MPAILDDHGDVRHIPLHHDSADSDASVIRLVHALLPEWERSAGEINLVRFTDGITNTVCRRVPMRPAQCAI